MDHQQPNWGHFPPGSATREHCAGKHIACGELFLDVQCPESCGSLHCTCHSICLR